MYMSVFLYACIQVCTQGVQKSMGPLKQMLVSFWDLHPGPLKERQMLLTTAVSPALVTNH